MKTQAKTKIEKAERLAEIIEMRRDIEKEEKELKEYFKEEIDGGVLEAGSVVIMIETKTREGLDRDGLQSLLGKKLEKFITVTTYEQVTVKKAA